MRLVEGKSFKAIAQETGRTEVATRVLLGRAKATLALEMDRLANEGTDKG